MKIFNINQGFHHTVKSVRSVEGTGFISTLPKVDPWMVISSSTYEAGSRRLVAVSGTYVLRQYFTRRMRFFTFAGIGLTNSACNFTSDAL